MKNILLISFALLFVGCNEDKALDQVEAEIESEIESSTTGAVSIVGSTFSPSSLTISIGDIVTWTNYASFNHSVVSDAGSSETWNSGNLSSEGTFGHQFDSVGEFGYHCGIHASMTGSITVIE